MRIRFWGARGSLPSPLLPSQVREKIMAALRRARPEDLADSKSIERFARGLPPWLFGTVGGNTSCVSLEADGLDGLIVFDCGSGMRELGKARRASPNYHVFMSHFHWDHLQGLPFFGPAFSPASSLDFYSPRQGFEGDLAGLMRGPYSPIGLHDLPAKTSFSCLEGPVSLGPASVSFKKMNHPGGSYSYRVECGGKSFIYATDVELEVQDFIRSEENAAFFTGADAIAIDAQYTPMEAIEKHSWGHSPYSMAAEFAVSWGIRRLILFHHDPTSDDRKLHEMLRSASRYLRHIGADGVSVSLAAEGREVVL